jgi:murein DD-endopeptidase MepM/ murein hydrolase activator NlpD
MTGSADSKARVFVAALALLAGYGAAAYAGAGRGEPAALRGPAVFGAINSAWDDGLDRASVGADTTLNPRGQMPRLLVAGTGPLRGGAIADFASRSSVLRASLEWAPVPAVPKPSAVTEALGSSVEGAAVRGVSLATPSPATEARSERAQTAMPVLETLAERMGVQGLGAQLMEEAPLFGARKKRSEPGRLPMSRSRSLDHAYSHAGDPLAVLQLDDDASGPEYIMPFANGRVTSLFNQGRRHPAIDLAGKLGSPVLATTSRQKVVFAGPRGGYGNAVITQDASGWTHLYGHLQRITSRVGQMLDQGDKLGHLGSTGHSTGPHVHYEVRNSRGTHVNPVTLLFPGRGVAKGYAWLDVRQESIPARVAARTW